MAEECDTPTPTPADHKNPQPGAEKDDQHEKRPEGPYKDPEDEQDQATVK